MAGLGSAGLTGGALSAEVGFGAEGGCSVGAGQDCERAVGGRRVDKRDPSDERKRDTKPGQAEVEERSALVRR